MDVYCKRKPQQPSTIEYTVLTDPKIEGLFTIIVAGIFAIFFPGTPKDAKSLVGFRYFSEREIHILNQRIYLDDPNSEKARKTISLKELTSTVSFVRTFNLRRQDMLTLVISHSLPIGESIPI
jgi:hypothetical protein